MSSEAKHDYHLVDPSPWPVVGSAFAFLMMVGAVFWMHKDYAGFFGLPVAGTPWIFLVGLLVCSTPWPAGGATSSRNRW
jgi:cytochrome c oxidase subunit 3